MCVVTTGASPEPCVFISAQTVLKQVMLGTQPRAVRDRQLSLPLSARLDVHQAQSLCIIPGFP